MPPGLHRPLLLGLLAPRGTPALPPIPLLAARAGWDAVWLSKGEPWPAEAAAMGVRIGWVIDDATPPVGGGAAVWVRGSAAAPASPESIAALCATVPAPQEVSADVVGMVWINGYKRVSPASPIGGVRGSGYGREMGFEAMHEYTQPKAVWVNVDAELPDWYPRPDAER